MYWYWRNLRARFDTWTDHKLCSLLDRRVCAYKFACPRFTNREREALAAFILRTQEGDTP